MRILLVIPLYPPDSFTSEAIFCHDLATWLEKSGHQVYILAGRFGLSDTSSSNVFRKMGLIFYQKGRSFTKHFQKNMVEKKNFEITETVVNEIFPDFVLFFSLEDISLSPYYYVVTKKIAHAVYISYPWFQNLNQTTLKAKAKSAIKYFLPYSMGETWKPSCLLFRSPYVLKNNKIFCSNKHWIPMGIDTDTIQNSKLKKDFCLFVSANTELPKIDSVLSIFSKLPFPEMKLTVFCDTSLDKMVAINNLIQKKSGKVHVEKFDFSKWEKEHHFQFMFAFSDIIQENVKLLFASMLNGAIIIAENHPDLDEIVGETMVNLQINDADVFIEEIKNLIENDEQRSVLQSEYRKKIIETYSYKQIFPKIEEIFIQEKEKQRIQ